MAVSDLRGLFNDLIRFEIELWNAVDARLKREFDLPLTHFEPMSVIDRRSSLLELTPAGQRILAEAGAAFDEELQRWLGAPVPERTLRQFAATLTRLRAASRRIDMEDSA